jgi:nucleoside-diphosphate-sugar epimerase
MGKNQTFLASDGADLSTAELLAKLKHLMHSKALLVPVPPALLQLGLTAIGKQAIAQRLLDSLEVDIQKTIEVLNWHPPQTVDEGLRETVRAFEAPYETRF